LNGIKRRLRAKVSKEKPRAVLGSVLEVQAVATGVAEAKRMEIWINQLLETSLNIHFERSQ
jgi:hypothetical protein